jgi:hypothetical protein
MVVGNLVAMDNVKSEVDVVVEAYAGLSRVDAIAVER